jgi:hypothetical protein
MEQASWLRKGGHTTFEVRYHVVWIPKNRKALLFYRYQTIPDPITAKLSETRSTSGFWGRFNETFLKTGNRPETGMTTGFSENRLSSETTFSFHKFFQTRVF